MAEVKREENGEKLEERVLLIKRVSKKTTGGNYVTFSALVVVGDRKGHVGIGVGRGLEVPPSIRKALAHARKSMIEVPIYKSSLPHEVTLKYKSSLIMLKPAPVGTGWKRPPTEADEAPSPARRRYRLLCRGSPSQA